MALMFMESWDHNVTADVLGKWTSNQITGSGGDVSGIVAAVGRRGSSGLRIKTGGSGNDYTKSYNKVLFPSHTKMVTGFAFKANTFSGYDTNGNPDSAGSLNGQGPNVFAVRNNSVTQCSLFLNSNGTISVNRQNAGSPVTLGTTAGTLIASAFTHIEVAITSHASAGVVIVRFDGVEVLNVTGVNTIGAGATVGWNEIRLGHFGPSGNSFTGEWVYDDLYVCDGSGSAPWNTFLGDCRVDPTLAIAVGASSGWTPSAGANWQCVDDVTPNGDTDFTSALPAGLTDTFVFQDAPVVGGTIMGIQHCLYMKKTDTGICTVAPVVRHGGADFVGSDLPPGTSYGYGLAVQSVNPGTGAAWTETGFNAAEFGYRKTS
jgi:hypothetical protein